MGLSKGYLGHIICDFIFNEKGKIILIIELP